MAKRNLAEAWVFNGERFGPGEVDLPADVDAALKARGAFERPDEGGEAGEASPNADDGDEGGKAPRRAAKG